MTNTAKRIAFGGLMAALVATAGTLGYQAGAHAQAAPPAPRVEKLLLDNAVFNIREITYQPGYRQQMHTVAAGRNEVLVQITPGKFEANIDGVVTTGHPGSVWYTPKAPSLHAFANAGDAPMTFLVVQAK